MKNGETSAGTMVPAVERLNNGRAIISRVESHPWENRVTFNPACILVHDAPTLRNIIPELPFDKPTRNSLESQPALCFLLYRAQGRMTDGYDHRRSSMGLALLSPDLRLLARHTEPILLPDQPYEDLGVEDGRLSRIGDTFLLTYTAYKSGTPDNTVRIALATTKDFVHWKKHGLLKGDPNTVDNKNAMLFPEKVNGKFLMLHRPMAGKDALCVHVAETDDVYGEWTTKGVIIRPIPDTQYADTWVGGGAPPLKLDDGKFLLIYHIGNKRGDNSRVYNLGIAVADNRSSSMIVRRDEPLLEPRTPAETTGDPELGVNNVVFICGAYFYQQDLYFPYAGADSVVLAGKISRNELSRYLGT